MGEAMSKAAQGAVEQETEELSRMLKLLNTMTSVMVANIQTKRGADAAGRETEVVGGRSVMRVVQMRVASSDSISEQITGALNDFFDAAQGGIDEDQEGAKASAIKGVKKAINATLNALIGVRNGQSHLDSGEFVTFMNNAFVQVIFYAYSYSVSAEAWGKEKRKASLAYVADIAVLGEGDLNQYERDGKLSDAIGAGEGDLELIDEVKFQLKKSALLSNRLKSKGLSLKDVAQIAEEYVASSVEVQKKTAALT